MTDDFESVLQSDKYSKLLKLNQVYLQYTPPAKAENTSSISAENQASTCYHLKVRHPIVVKSSPTPTDETTTGLSRSEGTVIVVESKPKPGIIKRSIFQGAYTVTIDLNAQQSYFEGKLSKAKLITSTPSGKPDKLNFDQIITGDIETYQDEAGKHLPYAAAIYKDGKSTMFYVTDFNSDPNEMMFAFLKELITLKHKGCSVNFHNLGKFDVKVKTP